MIVARRLFCYCCLVLTLAMLWTPAHASFPATQTNPGVCTVEPCTEYTNVAWVSSYIGSTRAIACAAAIPYFQSLRPTSEVLTGSLMVGTACWFTRTYNGGPDGNLSGGVANSRSVPVGQPTYSCPASSTLSGASCTCTAPSVENAAKNGCEAPKQCEWARGMSYAAGSDTFSLERGKNFCYGGCAFALDPSDPPSFSITHGGKKYDEVRMGNLIGTGAVASNCGAGDSSAPPAPVAPVDPPKAPKQPCPPGQSAGAQIIAPGGGGGYVCVTPEESEARKKKTVEKTEPDGSKTTTTIDQTTVCGQDSCNTTVNTSVSSGGTTQTTSETSTSGKDDFCKANPTDKNCTGTGGAGQSGNAGADQGSPDHPKLWEKKYPDGLSGVFSEKKAALLNTDIGKLAPKLMPDNIPANAGLPVWNLSLDLGGLWDFGVHDMAPSREVWDWAKVFVILGALLLARALIFGG